jgi:splicing factor 1
LHLQAAYQFRLGVSNSKAEVADDTNIFVNFIPPDYNDLALRELFLPYGNVLSAKVMLDLNTGLSKCYGFVKFEHKQFGKTIYYE